jgi:hypothetical protein
MYLHIGVFFNNNRGAGLNGEYAYAFFIRLIENSFIKNNFESIINGAPYYVGKNLFLFFGLALWSVFIIEYKDFKNIYLSKKYKKKGDVALCCSVRRRLRRTGRFARGSYERKPPIS